MSSFFVDLWESIFVPGPTPTILIAANASFAALQLVLLLLLVATYSVHFVVLSALCAGLWASINWFAAELVAAQARDAAAAKPDGADGSDTEVEGQVVGVNVKGPQTGTMAAVEVEPVEVVGELKKRGEGLGTQSSVSTEDEWEKVSESEKEKDK